MRTWHTSITNTRPVMRRHYCCHRRARDSHPDCDRSSIARSDLAHRSCSACSFFASSSLAAAHFAAASCQASNLAMHPTHCKIVSSCVSRLCQCKRSVENYMPRREECSTFWAHARVAVQLQQAIGSRVLLDRCEFDLRVLKPAAVSSDAPRSFGGGQPERLVDSFLVLLGSVPGKAARGSNCEAHGEPGPR